MGAIHQAVMSGLGGAPAMTFADLFAGHDGSGVLFGTDDVVCYVEEDVDAGTAGASTIAGADDTVGTFHDTINDIWHDLVAGTASTLRNPSAGVWCLENTGFAEYNSRTAVMDYGVGGVLAMALDIRSTSAGAISNVIGLTHETVGLNFYHMRFRGISTTTKKVQQQCRFPSGNNTVTGTLYDALYTPDVPFWALTKRLSGSVDLTTSVSDSDSSALTDGAGSYSAFLRLGYGATAGPLHRLYGFFARNTALTTEEETFLKAQFTEAWGG